MNKKQLLIGFGKRLRKLRNERGFSQESFAEEASIHRTYVGMIERGEKNVTLFSLKKLSEALKISLSDLFNNI